MRRKIWSLVSLLIPSLISITLLILLNASKLPSIYHVYLPSFNRDLNKTQNYKITSEEKTSNRGNLNGVISKLPLY